MTTGIQWCDETWNPVVGCEQVSRGCDHCYAKALHDMRHAAHLAGKKMAPQYAQPFETVQLKPERLHDPLHWKAPRRIFVNSVSDLFHKDVPQSFLESVFTVMARTPRHTYQILTKRPERMLNFFMRMSLVGGEGDELYAAARGVWPLPNVWLGVSVENQATADKRIPVLMRVPAAVRFLSCEPLLGPVDLRRVYRDVMDDAHGISCIGNGELHWVIVGGESGKGARPMDIQWARSLVAQCKDHDVKVFAKQMGDAPYHLVDGVQYPVSFGRHGADFASFEEALRVREFPPSPASQRTTP